MNSYTIGSIVMIVALAIFTCIIAGRLIYLASRKESKAEFKNYIKTYKYGKFLWVYLLSIPLFAMSYHYSGNNGFDCFFKAFTSASKLMALQFDVSLELAKVNHLYQITVTLCYCIAILNVVLFVASCLGQILWNWFATLGFKYGNNDKCLILGHGERSEAIYNSIAKAHGSKTRKMIADVLEKKDKWDLYTRNIHYHGSSDSEKLQKYTRGLLEKLLDKYNKTFKKVWKSGKGAKSKPFPKLRIIINFNEAKDNANMCAYLSTLISGYVKSNNKNVTVDEQKLNCLPYLDVYIYGDSDSKSLYSSYNIDFNGCLHFISNQEIIALNFIKNNPIAKYLTSKLIDYETSLLKPSTRINISFVGFGKTQQEVFKMLYSNTQFVKQVGKKLTSKCVDYFIYDKVKTWEGKNLNHTYNKYFSFIESSKFNPKNYLPLPEINKVKFSDEDVDDPDFLSESLNKLREQKRNKNLKVIFISLSSDLASIEYANRLWKIIESEKIKNTQLFVKISDKDTYDNMCKMYANRKIKKLNSSCNAYGCLIDTVLNYESIMLDDITRLAAMGDTIYNHSIYEVKTGDTYLNFNEPIIEQARYKWEKDSEYNRNSSIASAIHLRSKLLVMGLDYVKNDVKIDKAFSNYKAYWNELDSDYKPTLYKTKIDNLVNGKDFLSLKLPKDSYFETDSRRWALVYMEHSRWVAFNIINGYIPRSIKVVEQTGKDKDKTLEIPQHACMTTMEGLKELGKILKKYNKDNKGDAETDKIKLDYLQFDAAWQFLDKIGCKIVEKDAKLK